jgi:peptidoglycan biosynthesis protein MviN/MurJ (putative lipid II flippase)
MFSIALAQVIPLFFQFILLFILSRRYIEIQNQKISFYLKILLATIITSITTFYLQKLIKWDTPTKLNFDFLKNIFFTGALSIFYLALFSVLSYLFKIEEFHKIFYFLTKKRGKL